MSQYVFHTLDVFTDNIFGGNPLAVFPYGVGLETEQMQAVASEFNLSETVFVFPPDHPAHTRRLRIFTPRTDSLRCYWRGLLLRAKRTKSP